MRHVIKLIFEEILKINLKDYVPDVITREFNWVFTYFTREFHKLIEFLTL